MEHQREKRRKKEIKAYAKVNLFLDVLGKRDDGYHDILTAFSEISLFDDIIFTLTKNQEIKIWSSSKIIDNEENIIFKVAFFIKEKYRVKKGVNILLKKNIPLQAGLGGGSSDAAATIKALNHLWNLGLDSSEKHLIAEKFGSDINFFLEGGLAVGKGRGEKITPFEKDVSIENIVLIKPDWGISTKEAYALLENYSADKNRWKKFIEFPTIDNAYNAFEYVVLEKYPEIKEIFEKIKSENEKPLLSGSGATVIAFCKSRKSAEKIKKYFANNYWTYITKTMRRQK